MWIFSVGDSGKITKQHKKDEAPPPVIQLGNPPPLLELINRHSLVIFLLVRSFGLHRSHMLLIHGSILGQCSNWSNQSNNFDHVYFGRLGIDHPSFILGNPLRCTTFYDCFLEDKAITVFIITIIFVMRFVCTYLSKFPLELDEVCCE